MLMNLRPHYGLLFIQLHQQLSDLFFQINLTTISFLGLNYKWLLHKTMPQTAGSGLCSLVR